MALPPNQAFGASYTLNLIGKVDTTFSTAGGGSGARPAVVVIIRADTGNNSGTPALWGFNSAQQPIAPGEAVALDIPSGYWVDLQELHFSGNGNTGQTIYVTAVILRG